jgi:excisionase family DNA binding protein
MSAYATSAEQLHPLPSRNDGATNATGPLETLVMESLLAQLADRLATAVVEQIRGASEVGDDWFDSRHAADYLGVHRDTLRKLAAERAIPSEQDGPGCKLYFRRSDLDAWRRGGGRPSHLAAVVRRAA